MQLTVHKDDDALYLQLEDTPILESEEVSDGIILDYNAEGKVVGIEVLYTRQRSLTSWQPILLETAWKQQPSCRRGQRIQNPL